MEGQKLRVSKQGREAMSALAQLRDGDAALLYACAASCDGGCTLTQAAQMLDLTPERVKRASQLLLVYGLAVNHTAPPPRSETGYPSQELAQARAGDAAFSGLCDYFEASQGRILNRRELETLLNVYQTLGLPPEVLTLLMGDCAQRGRLTAREVEKQAYRWYDLGLDNYEQAASYLARQRERETRGAKVLSMLGIHDRLPGESEQKYIDKWAEMGVTDELLRLAYDKTLLGTGRLSWPYLHKILCTWREQGFRTVKDVETAPDSRNRQGQPAQLPQSAETVILQKLQQKRQQRGLVLEQRREELRRQSEAFAENESSMRLFASKMARARPSEKAKMALEYQQFVARQQEVLRQLGKPEDWLLDRPDCPLCGDRGYVGTQKCRCLEQALAAQNNRI
ncbi:MAG: DnaD domain protein [Clostridia bacterium]|nr:DnaD domain protein [Clostridia bacterium]